MSSVFTQNPVMQTWTNKVAAAGTAYAAAGAGCGAAGALHLQHALIGDLKR